MRGGINALSIYLVDSVGLDETNKAIPEHVAVALNLLEGPWVAAGEWTVVRRLCVHARGLV